MQYKIPSSNYILIDEILYPVMRVPGPFSTMSRIPRTFIIKADL